MMGEVRREEGMGRNELLSESALETKVMLGGVTIGMCCCSSRRVVGRIRAMVDRATERGARSVALVTLAAKWVSR